MSRYRTVDYKCRGQDCGHFEILLLDLSSGEDTDIEGKPLEVRTCPICDRQTFQRQLAVPMNLKASYPDGLRGKKDDWRKLKEASKLNKEAASSRDDRKKEIAKEIKKLGVRVSK